jgi:6,7-dimethyl-8-ribityllumazine synthase
MIKTIEGALSADKSRFCLVVSRWNSYIVESLEKGAIDTLKRHGADDGRSDHRARARCLRDAGDHQRIAAKGGYDAIIALGAVIRGGTPHFEYVAGECVKGMAQVSLHARASGRVRGADGRHHRAGHRARRYQGRQQGRRGGHVRAGNGRSVSAHRLTTSP